MSRAILYNYWDYQEKGYADFQQSDNICILPFQIPIANLVSQKVWVPTLQN